MSEIHEIPKDDGAQKWSTLQVIVFATGLAAALFVAGMSYGTVASTASRVDALQESMDRNFVRKDGKELAEIQGKLNLLNEKVDQLLQRKSLP